MSLGIGPVAIERAEAALLLEIRPSTVAKWLRKGYIERVVKGNKWMVGLESVRQAQGKSFMWMKKGPYYDANRELVKDWVLAQLESPKRSPQKKVSGDAESFDG